MSAEKRTINVNIDCTVLARIAHVGVRRAALFLGLGLNGVNQPGFQDYELHKLPESDNPAVIVPDLIARGASEDAIKRFKGEFSTWVTGCGLREMLEHYGTMLDRMYEHCLLVAHSRGSLADLGDPLKLLSRFERHGVKGKHAALNESFRIAPQFTANVDGFYSARNALTHGLGFVRPGDATDGTLRLNWVAMEMHAKGEETGTVTPIRKLFGVVTTEPMGIYLAAAKRGLAFKIGEKVNLSAQDLYEICMFMSAQVIPTTISAFLAFLRGQEIPTKEEATSAPIT